MANIIRCKKDVAVIGAGHWGKNYIRILNEKRRLHTVCETKLQFRLPEAIGWVKNPEYIQENPQIKSVVIATPPETHFKLAIEMLKSGKHVLVEKPMCMSSTEGVILGVEARSDKRILMVGHLLRYHPAFRKVLELINADQIGKLNYIYASRLNLGRIRENENVWWSFAPHDISMILALTGKEPTKVRACGSHNLKRIQCDSTMTLMSFGNDIGAHIFVSWLHPFKRHELVCIGSRGMITFDDCKSWDEKICVSMLRPDITSIPEYEPVKQAEPLEIEIDHFLECCDASGKETEVSPVTDAAEGISVLKILERAQQSMEDNNGREQ